MFKSRFDPEYVQPTTEGRLPVDASSGAMEDASMSDDDDDDDEKV